MATEDRTVGEKVKVLLVRKGVDLSLAAFGVTNGVVTITGSLHTSHDGSKDGLDGVVQEVALARWLERKLKRMDGVRDVTFRLNRVWNAQLGED
jgi:hypothetical protein